MKILFGKYSTNYLWYVSMRLAHHSLAMVGNSATRQEVAAILGIPQIPKDLKLSKDEITDVVNHGKAFDYMIDQIESGNKISVPIFEEIYNTITGRSQPNKRLIQSGINLFRSRTSSVRLPKQSREILDRWSDNIYFDIDRATSEKEKVKAILAAHISLIKLQPFPDANELVARLIMNYSIIENRLTPIIIQQGYYHQYIEILEEAKKKDRLTSNDLEKFYQFIVHDIENEKKSLELHYELKLKEIEKNRKSLEPTSDIHTRANQNEKINLENRKNI